MGEKMNAYRILVGKPEGKRPLGRPRRRWVDNIRMGVGEIGWDEVDWFCVTQDRGRCSRVVLYFILLKRTGFVITSVQFRKTYQG
jgi:hypothetical protein